MTLPHSRLNKALGPARASNNRNTSFPSTATQKIAFGSDCGIIGKEITEMRTRKHQALLKSCTTTMRHIAVYGRSSACWWDFFVCFSRSNARGGEAESDDNENFLKKGEWIWTSKRSIDHCQAEVDLAESGARPWGSSRFSTAHLTAPRLDIQDAEILYFSENKFQKLCIIVRKTRIIALFSGSAKRCFFNAMRNELNP